MMLTTGKGHYRLGWPVLCLLTLALLSCGGDDSVPVAAIGETHDQIELSAGAVLPTVPAAPGGLMATSGNGEVSISWNEVVGADSYNLYYLTYPGVMAANARQIAAAKSGEPITGLRNTVPHYFRVTAVNSVGESELSAEVSATPMPAVPGIPGNVRLVGGLGEATLFWQAVPYATSYNIYYGTTPGLTPANAPHSIKGLNLTSQKITGLNLAPGHYYFRVTAMSVAGEGPPSVERVAVAKSGYKDVAAGFGHSAAIRIIEPTLPLVNNGTVWHWGDNSSGQLGDGTNSLRQTAQLTPTIESVTQISAGYHHTIALKTDTSIYNWGLNSKGQLGDNNTTSNRNQPFQAFIRPPALMTAVDGGYQHTAALRDDGTIWTWGFNPMGALGYRSLNCESPTDVNQPESYSCSFTPTQVPGIVGLVRAIAAGYGHTLAVTPDNSTVWAWGRNDTGQLGTENSFCPDSLVAASPESTGFTVDDPFPTPTKSCSTTPVEVDAIPGTVTAVAAGTRHSVALLSDGTVWTWGGNRYGQLGYTPDKRCQLTSAFMMECSTKPQLVQGLENIIAISAGSDHNLALKNDGTVWSWGYQFGGRLVGQEMEGGTSTQTPEQIPGLSGITAIAAGAYHSLALKDNGSAWAWGYNGHGQLGNGTKTDSATPVQVQDLLWPVVIIPGN